jgi:hypothetical protein
MINYSKLEVVIVFVMKIHKKTRKEEREKNRMMVMEEVEMIMKVM